MTKERYILLKKLGWFLFFVLLIVNSINFGFRTADKLFISSVPFTFNEGNPEDVADAELNEFLQNKIITRIDTIDFTDGMPIPSEESTEENPLQQNNLRFTFLDNETESGIQINSEGPLTFSNRDSVEIAYLDTLTNVSGTRYVNLINRIDTANLSYLILLLILLIFTFFNSYLLLRYSNVEANVLIVFFLLFLMSSKPDTILPQNLIYFWEVLITPFWGVLFYHFIVIKVKAISKIKRLYIISAIIFGLAFIVSLIFQTSFDLVHIWSGIFMLKGFLLLRKEYKRSQSIEQKRLWAAFSGIGISFISIASIIIVGVLIALIAGVSNVTGLSLLLKSYSNILGIIVGIVILIPVLGIFLGFFWFPGSFSWSLLTGTVLDVKIRSTLIYTIVGVFFVTTFGLVDYSLGEILQNIFGKFMGSEFIAGIPVTIGLIAFFNPVRDRVERIVDKKLNTTELDFLEKTETFTHNLSEEGVLEGFEEYICENLIALLPIEKIALISFDENLQYFKFNEIRGSEVIENSQVEDIWQSLHKTYKENFRFLVYGVLPDEKEIVLDLSLLSKRIAKIDWSSIMNLFDNRRV